MTRSEIDLLVEFNYWARDRMLDAVSAASVDEFTRPIESSFSSVRDTLVHIYSAEWVWYTRWQGESPSAPIATHAFADLATLVAAWRRLEGQIRAYVGSQDDAALDRTIEYRLINGQPGRSVLWQMVQHVVNHGSYHRGQVTTMLRQLGLPAPKGTDLITFYRERAA
jgi:uncharacterized damage-inducible protein DinB